MKRLCHVLSMFSHLSTRRLGRRAIHGRVWVLWYLCLPEAFLQWQHKKSHIAKNHFAFDPSKVACISIWQKFLVLLLSSNYKLHPWGEDAHHASRSSFSPFSKTSSQICRWSWQLRSVRGSKITAGPLFLCEIRGIPRQRVAAMMVNLSMYEPPDYVLNVGGKYSWNHGEKSIRESQRSWFWMEVNLDSLNVTVHCHEISWHAFLRWQLLLGRSQCFVQRQCIQHWIQVESVQTPTRSRFNAPAWNTNAADVLVSGCQMII